MICMYHKLMFISNMIEQILLYFCNNTCFLKDFVYFSVYCKITVFCSHVSLNLVFLHSAIDVSECCIQNRSKPEEITLREGYGNDLLFHAGSFGENI